MTNDEWVRERAEQLLAETINHSNPDIWTDKATTALREAIERTREEERALAAEALKLAHEMQDKAVADARKQGYEEGVTVGRNIEQGKYAYDLDAFHHGRDDVLDKLREPDEAVLEALGTSQMFTPEEQRERLDRLASILTETEEGDDV